jgi:hypothetical protein
MEEKIRNVFDRQFSELTSLAIIQRFGNELKLFITVMLKVDDFNCFAGLVDAHYCNDIEYLIELPFYGFPYNEIAQEDRLTSSGHILPLREAFHSGKPMLIPNGEISFALWHLSEDKLYKYKWIETARQRTVTGRP